MINQLFVVVGIVAFKWPLILCHFSGTLGQLFIFPLVLFFTCPTVERLLAESNFSKMSRGATKVEERTRKGLF